MSIFNETAPQRLLSKEEATVIFEEVVALRNASPYPFVKAEDEQAFRTHSLLVASIAEKIAEKASMDSQKAYILGYLHDSGRYKNERKEKVCHSIEGYKFLTEHNLPECARISITHSFYQRNINRDLYIYTKEQLDFCSDFLSKIEYNDYDRLIQLSDVLNNIGETCSINYRFSSISRRYNIPMHKYKETIDMLNNIKEYFDKKCGCDIYTLFDIKE